MIDIGTAVWRRRTMLELTQAELAEKAHVGLCTVSNIEIARSGPRLDTLCRIAEALEVELSSLIKEAETGELFADIAK